MSLHRPANVLGAILWCLCGVALLASEIFTIAHLIQWGEWQGENAGIVVAIGFPVLAYAFVVFIFAILFMAMPIQAFRQIRVLRAAAECDERVTAQSAYQPDKTLALRDGETLLLSRYRTFKQIALFWLKVAFLVMIELFCVEGFIALLLPSFSRSSLNPFYFSLDNPSRPRSPSLADWLAAIFQLAILLAFLTILAYANYRDHRETITADDRGITIKRSGRPTRALAWTDLQVFVRITDTVGSSPVGTYGLWGSQQGTWLDIHSQESATVQDDTAKRPGRAYTYPDGYSTYKQNAERLVATVSARSYQPLRVVRKSSATHRARRGRAAVIKVAGMSVEEIAVLPAVQAHPSTPAAVTPLASPTAFSLNARLPSRFGVALETLIIAAAFFAVVFLLMRNLFDLQTALPPETTTQVKTWVTIGAYAFIGVLCLPIGWAFAVTHRRLVMPIVLVDVSGIQGYSPLTRQETKIPWSDVIGWVAIPLTVDDDDTIWYVLFGADRLRIIWRVSASFQLAGGGVRGDRRVAFRERADELHALILARTGLPLHEFTDESRVISLGGASAGSSIEQ